MKSLMRIGAFAKLGRVSVKALRFYESKGLLTPQHIDAATGYRYYTIEQSARLALISNLRAASFSIKEIAAIIDAGNDKERATHLVDTQRQKLLAERASIDKKLEVLETLANALEGSHDNPLSVVKLDSVPALKAYTIRATVAGLGEPITELFETAEETVAKHDARLPSAPFLLFHNEAPAAAGLDVEVCIPVKSDASPDLKPVCVDGHSLACCVIYSGNYAQTDTLRSAIDGWIKKVGLTAAGPLREVYHRFGADQINYNLPDTLTTSRTEEFITELQMPIANAT